MTAETILIFCAHSDDSEVGMGGTIAKYIDEGKKITTITFSYGEKSTPHLREEVVKQARIKETEKVDKFLGKETIFLGLEEGKIEEQVTEEIKEKVKQIIKEKKPSKIFTLSSLDTHKDHRDVNKAITSILEEMNYKGDVFAFEVWNVLNETNPRLYIDISKYFRKKLKLIRMFKSQRHFLYPLWIPVYIRAKLNGMKNKCRYAEVFYKIR